MGDVVGASDVGEDDGELEGFEIIGDLEGFKDVGLCVGFRVGDLEGLFVGAEIVGDNEGDWLVGNCEGDNEGIAEKGDCVGERVQVYALHIHNTPISGVLEGTSVAVSIYTGAVGPPHPKFHPLFRNAAGVGVGIGVREGIVVEILKS